jgi:SynChlorMet cassette radical SAM/SPASM protein ScmE
MTVRSRSLMPTPRELDLEITSRCNARCKYCYYLNNEEVTYEDLPTSRWLEFFEEMGRARVMRVCVGGGEALLREDFFELIDGIVRNRMRFQLMTNGRLITPEIARRLRETGRCESVQVSLDGSRAAVHESMRGKGSFKPALNAIRVLREAGLPTTVRVTIHPRNLDDLSATARLLLEEICLPAFSTNSASSLGTRTKYGDSILLTPAQRLRAIRIMAELDARYPGRIQAAAGPLADWKAFNEMESARLSGKPIPGRGRLVGCGSLFSRMTVRADGAYVPCVTLPQIVLGYIGKDLLAKVWRTSPRFNTLRRRNRIPLERFEECRGCEYLSSCTGSCAGSALSLTGDANRPSPDSCLRRFKKELAAEGLSLW